MCNLSRHEAAHASSSRSALSHHASYSHSHHYGPSESDVDAPSPVLLVRMLPEDIEEGEVRSWLIPQLICDCFLPTASRVCEQLHVAFGEFDGVKDIRLIRDRTTSLSRGFGFVEFVDVEVRRA